MFLQPATVAAQVQADSTAQADSLAQAPADSLTQVKVDSLVQVVVARADSISNAKDSTEAARDLAATKLFNFSLGASFDIFNGLQANDLYGDVSAYVPPIGKKFPIALDFRIAQGRSFVSRKSLTAERSILTNYVDPQSSEVKRGKELATGTTDIEETREIVSVSAAIHIVPDKKERFAFIGYAEHRAIEENRKFVNLALDTTVVDMSIPDGSEIKARRPSRFFTVGNNEHLSEGVSRDKNTLVGIGFGIDIPIEDFQFKIRPLLLLDRDRRNPESNVIRIGHVVVFELIEWRSKVKLGGEVRRDPGAPETEVEFSLYLSKVVSLQNFFKGIRNAL